jgi:hypothetical protein
MTRNTQIHLSGDIQVAPEWMVWRLNLVPGNFSLQNWGTHPGMQGARPYNGDLSRNYSGSRNDTDGSYTIVKTIIKRKKVSQSDRRARRNNPNPDIDTDGSYTISKKTTRTKTVPWRDGDVSPDDSSSDDDTDGSYEVAETITKLKGIKNEDVPAVVY